MMQMQARFTMKRRAALPVAFQRRVQNSCKEVLRKNLLKCGAMLRPMKPSTTDRAVHHPSKIVVHDDACGRKRIYA